MFAPCSASNVMRLLRPLANEGTTVCAAIHSPSAYAFKQFDSVMLLLRGEVVYFGPAGETAGLYGSSWFKVEISTCLGEHAGLHGSSWCQLTLVNALPEPCVSRCCILLDRCRCTGCHLRQNFLAAGQEQ